MKLHSYLNASNGRIFAAFHAEYAPPKNIEKSQTTSASIAKHFPIIQGCGTSKSLHIFFARASAISAWRGTVDVFMFDGL